MPSVHDTAIPLPHGTDVVTSVAQFAQGHELAAGTVGRVVGTGDGYVDLQVLGIGVVRYRRSDVTPFRSGQLRYAVAREAAFRALSPNIVLEAVVGSRAWGLATESSDTDLRGAFVLPFPWHAKLGEAPEDLVSADGSATYWEVEKVVLNGLRADPNALELLFVQTVRPTDELGALILRERDALVSSRIHASFGQYALSQLKKLERGLRLAEHRDLVLGWLRDDPRLSLDAAASALADAAGIVAPTREASVMRAKEYLKQLYASLFDQGLLAEKTFEALATFADAHRDPSELPRKLRPKNAYNLLRLLITATGWLRTGAPVFDMTGPAREELMAIKRGDVPLERVLARAEELARDLEDAHLSTRLPERPDLARAQALLQRVREAAARRWLDRNDDAFGRLAAEVPLPEWKA